MSKFEKSRADSRSLKVPEGVAGVSEEMVLEETPDSGPDERGLSL